MHNVPEDIELLMAQYFDGSIQEDDRTTLKAWVEENEDHKKQFEQNQLIWQLSANQLDVDSAWENVSRRLNFDSKASKSQRSRFYLLPYLKYAAAVFILLLGAFLINNWMNEIGQMNHFAASDEMHEIELSEGTYVNLKANSSLYYPSNFEEKERKVKLEGKAYFDVTENPSKPFIVDLDILNVTVLGTSFFIEAEERSDVIRVSVSSGKVKVEDLKETNTVFLIANEYIEYYRLTGKWSEKQNFRQEEAEWLKKEFEFKNLSLEKVFLMIEEEFRLKIEYDSSLSDCYFSARIETVHAEDIIEQICLLYKLDYSKHQYGFQIHGISTCD